MTTPDVAAQLRALPSAFTELVGLRIDTLTPEEVTVDPARHLHAWGAVHGGVYCTLIETLATLGAQLSAQPIGKLASGLENHTSFLRQVRDGELKALGGWGVSWGGVAGTGRGTTRSQRRRLGWRHVCFRAGTSSSSTIGAWCTKG